MQIFYTIWGKRFIKLLDTKYHENICSDMIRSEPAKLQNDAHVSSSKELMVKWKRFEIKKYLQHLQNKTRAWVIINLKTLYRRL